MTLIYKWICLMEFQSTTGDLLSNLNIGYWTWWIHRKFGYRIRSGGNLFFFFIFYLNWQINSWPQQNFFLLFFVRSFRNIEWYNAIDNNEERKITTTTAPQYLLSLMKRIQILIISGKKNYFFPFRLPYTFRV